MESNLQQEECLKSSSEETDQSEQGNDEIGTGRSYECVFCKRGFTTAQALGGHMNIHRKDRAKARPSSVPWISSKVDESYSHAGPGFYQPYYSITPEVQVNYQTFFPAPTWRPPSTQNEDDFYMQNPNNLKPFGEDWRGAPHLQFAPSHVDDQDNGKREGSSEEVELDLELRLGYYP